MTWDRAVLIASMFLVLGTFRGFLLAPCPAGWDTYPHIHLFYKMVHLLKEGTLFGYDLEWFGGYPLFVFYGFAPYLPAAAIHVLSFGAIPILWLAKATIIAVPLLSLIAVYLFVGTYFGKRFRFAGLIAFQAYLWYPLSPQTGIGLSGAVHHGLFISLLGTTLILLILTCLEKNRQSGRAGYFIGAIFLSATLAFSHVISSAVAAVTISVYFFEQKRFGDWARFSLWVGLLSAFYVYPYATLGNLTNGTKLSGLAFENNIDVFMGLNWHALGRPDVFWEIPLLRLVLAASFFVGLKRLVDERRYFLPTVFFLYLFFVGTDYLFQEFRATLHYYRFHAFFFVIFLMIATAGLQAIIDWCVKRHSLSIDFLNSLLALGVIPLIMYMPYHGETIDWKVEYKEEAALMAKIQALKPSGRVMVERSELEPNPHLFTVALPLLHHTPVLLGLLVESAENAKYIVPLLRTVSHSQAWGRYANPIDTLTYGDVLLRLADAGAELVVLHDAAPLSDMAVHMRSGDAPRVLKAGRQGDYQIFRLPNVLPPVSGLRHAPILCVNDETAVVGTNEDILVGLFRGVVDPNIRIAFFRRSDGLPLSDAMKDFKTLILVGPTFRPETMEAARAFKGDLIILSNDPTQAQATFKDIPHEYFSFYPIEIEEFHTYLTDTYPLSPPAPITPTLFSDMKIQFDHHGPVVVNIGYFPYWHANGRPVFRISPSKILVFADGPTTLEFRLPGFQKFLMLISFISGLLLIINPLGWSAPRSTLRNAA